jgi:hypothetical protein
MCPNIIHYKVLWTFITLIIMFYHVWEPIRINWNSIWLRARSHMTSHHSWGSVTTLHDCAGVLGRPLDTFFWALTISWSRLLARVWSGRKIPKEVMRTWIWHLREIPGPVISRQGSGFHFEVPWFEDVATVSLFPSKIQISRAVFTLALAAPVGALKHP